ncbi:tyrosine-type recombinase/integrase (plasmid) [Cupriavidus necator]|nr:tyrosine-type recombinase/integrase [Cupriavidus necator]UIF87935.1 tyrosine-type recombinase/integrase [Cupriavidus necator]UIF88193.1 tyrosine-type recombinase/integrase [Cupriavidus necator]UIF88493.1 tyrosine-type recombinase/integrase [Cupriavidus necator]UIF88684.1 tyrosine-type recombinase/integrase [Cupriavidus necator]
MNQPQTPLDLAIERYLLHWRALGRRYVREEHTLRSLSRFLNEHGFSDLTQHGFETWCQAFSSLRGITQRNQQLIVCKLCRFRQRTEPDCFVPDRRRFRRSSPHDPPVIVSGTEIARMLDACDRLRATWQSPLRPALCRVAVVLLYSAGLRRGELVRLTLADVNEAQGVLHIRESKCHKSRFLPLSEDARAEVRRYLRKRLQAQFDCGLDAPLLCHCVAGFHGYSGGGFQHLFTQVMSSAQIQGADGRQPRILDLRHSFAIGALLRWYKDGADVQVKLPKLSMYMGHVSILSTAHYLRWTPALAQAASEQFEVGFGSLIDGGTS